MRRITTRILGIGAAVMLSATLASAQAPDTNRTTIVTFSAPVSLPGVTLPAGSYLFKLADSQVNRNIVQVFDKDRSKIYATILAIPAQRNQPADETVITFRESPANAAPAIQYWYYPGETMGQEFAYPKKQAMEIANATHKSVLSIDTDDTSADAMSKGQISRVEPGADANSSMAQGTQSTSPSQTTAQSNNAGSPTASQSTTPEATPSTQSQSPSPSATAAPAQTSSTDQSSAASTAQRSQGNQSNTTPSMSSSSNTSSKTQGAVGTSGSTSPRSSRNRLPKTASTLPLIGLAGLLALGSAFGIGALRRAYA
jgi:hypothetical protein